MKMIRLGVATTGIQEAVIDVVFRSWQGNATIVGTHGLCQSDVRTTFRVTMGRRGAPHLICDHGVLLGSETRFEGTKDVFTDVFKGARSCWIGRLAILLGGCPRDRG